MNIIVAVDSEWRIGYKGGLLAGVKEDLQNFARLTTGKTVILGSNTLATFPGGRVLKDRRNIVLNPDPEYAPEGAVVVHSLEELFACLESLQRDGLRLDDVFCNRRRIAYAGSCCRIVRKHMSRYSAAALKKTSGSQTWTSFRNGGSSVKASRFSANSEVQAEARVKFHLFSENIAE